MNAEQEKFLQFILERVAVANQDKARALLKESFEKQDNATFSIEFLQIFNPKLLELIMPPYYEEVKDIIYNFKV